ncbi:MAG: DsbA family protein [Rhizobiales bacterium]|nr:DsbA family protein [Hyphomicrobiales bacterium]
MTPVRISYYSDVLCIWAYAAQRRLEELVDHFGDNIEIEMRFCSVFPDAWSKIEDNWRDKKGFEGFNRHLLEVAEGFPHISVHERIWIDTKPRSSLSAHLFVKAVELVENERSGNGSQAIGQLESLPMLAVAELRRAFFESALDISDWQVHKDISDTLGIDYKEIDQKIRSSEAVAFLAADYEDSQKNGVVGSPTFIMNNGRQKLFGNVGYKLLEANVQELLRRSPQDEASWC